MKFFFGINISTNKKEMIQTLQEALEANSLEHKLEMQIKASLDSDVNESDYNTDKAYGNPKFTEPDYTQINEKNELVDRLVLPKKLDNRISRYKPSIHELAKVDEWFLKMFGVQYDYLHRLNYTIITQTFFNKNFTSITPVGSIQWNDYNSNKKVDIGAWEAYDDIVYGTYDIPNTTKLIIFSYVRELDLSKMG